LCLKGSTQSKAFKYGQSIFIRAIHITYKTGMQHFQSASFVSDQRK